MVISPLGLNLYGMVDRAESRAAMGECLDLQASGFKVKVGWIDV
jgi:hypothetical protein